MAENNRILNGNTGGKKINVKSSSHPIPFLREVYELKLTANSDCCNLQVIIFDPNNSEINFQNNVIYVDSGFIKSM